MKSSISNLISFVIMCIITLVLLFLSFESHLTRKYINNTLDKQDFYKEAYGNIINKIDDFIVNDDVRKSYEEYITLDMVKNDVKSTLNNIYLKKEQLSKYDEFYNIIGKYSNDEAIKKVYATNINDIYLNNLFPKTEFSLIYKLYISLDTTIFISISTMIVAIALSLALYFINRNLKFFISIFTGVCFIGIVPFIFKVFGLFKNFIYTNNYYTKFLLSIVNGTINYLFISSIIIVISLLLYKIKNNLN